MFLGLNVRLAVKSISSKKIETYSNKIPETEKMNFKIYRKKYPKIFSGKLNINLSINIAKETMGYSCLKSKEDLLNILGWNSYIKIFLANLIKKIYNIKYQFIR
jgi:hypothetical protein